MKTNKLYIALLTVAALVFGSCSSSYLDRDPIGSTIVESQYQKLPNALEGSLRGIYSLMYAFGGHDEFGQRSIDMYGDLLSGDMALTSQSYGWFYTDESQLTRTSRSGYLWFYYYKMIHNTNAVIRAARESTTTLDTIAKYGLPNFDLAVRDSEGNTLYQYSEADAQLAGYYAQALTMRGYAYSGLLRFFCPTVAHIYKDGYNINTYPAFPLYTEANMDSVQPMAIIADVYTQVETDLKTAIDVFAAFDGYVGRANKLEADINVARGLLAYHFINRAYLSNAYDGSMPLVKDPMTQALQYATDVINSGEYTIITNDELTTTGFNNVDHKSWIWGEDVTTETATGLGSFFGQVDIHSYSYAWAGDTKVIDKELYDNIPLWDGRMLWFNDGKANPSFLLCPDGKFFSIKQKAGQLSTAADDIDREWLSDNVYMRLELMYLIAAEASYFLNDMTGAIAYLDAVMSERLNPYYLGSTTDYAAFLATLTDRTTFAQELYRNWRLEMWGEGYGLQTFRRLSYLYKDDTHSDLDKVYRGSNHLYNPGKPIEYTDETIYTINIPSSETTYNPHMQDN